MTSFISLSDRIKHVSHPTTKQLLSYMQDKKSNLALSADVTCCKKLLNLAESIGDHIVILKTHIDILENFHPEFILNLQNIAKEKNFLLFEDRKFADIGHTVHAQYHQGIYRISSWANIINAHALPGDGVIQGLKNEKGHLPSILLIAEMSSQGHLLNPQYQQATLEMAKRHRDVVTGFITQHRLTDDPEFIHMAPGIGIHQQNDILGQQYTSPETAILEHGIDIIIVGRGIIKNPDPKQSAIEYQQRAWKALNLAIG